MSAKEWKELGVAHNRIRANGRCRVAQRSDRLSVEELAPQTVSRPALALSRGLLGVSEAVADIAGAKQSGGAPHIGLGLGQASQTDNRELPWAWNVVGFFLLWVGRMCLSVWLPCDWRRKRSIPASTARKSKRRFRVDSGEKRSRQREFASAGEAGATDTVTQERCRVSIGEPEGTISRPEVRSGR